MKSLILSLILFILILPTVTYAQNVILGKVTASVDSSITGIKIVDISLNGTISDVEQREKVPIDIQYNSANIESNHEFAVGYLFYKTTPSISNPIQFSFADFIPDSSNKNYTSSVDSVLHSSYLNVNNSTDKIKTFYINQMFNGKNLSADIYTILANSSRLCYLKNNSSVLTKVINGSDTSKSLLIIDIGSSVK